MRRDSYRIPEVFSLERLKGHDLNEITIEQLQHLLSEPTTNRLTSVEYVQYCLERIRKVNTYLECVIEVNPDAVGIAVSLDDERRRGTTRGKLHGIPILIKDNMATEDKMQTTAGSWALLGSVVPRDAHLVSLLRQSGAIILGKTNLCEWAAVRSSKYSHGYSPRGGQVRNPYDLSSSPHGSSSGSAVAVSANIVPLAFGTETDTSIIGPASNNGVVGIKPTVGLTSRSGVIPISTNMDSVGPFGRTVADAVHGLNVIVGTDERDPMTCSPLRPPPQDYTKHLTTKASLKGAIFGRPGKRCWELVPAERKQVACGVLDAIRAAGGEVIRIEFPCAEDRIPPDGRWDWEYKKDSKPSESEFTVAKVDAYNDINGYLSELSKTSIRSVEDIIKYNESNTGTEGAESGDHPAFMSGQNLWREVAETRGQKDETYHQALNYTQAKCRKEGIDAALRYVSADNQRKEFDALLLFDRLGPGQQLAAQAGYPIICIPIGVDSAGIPFSLSIQHTAWKEDVLIKWASAIEDLVLSFSGGRVTPTYRNHLSKNLPIAENDTG